MSNRSQLRSLVRVALAVALTLGVLPRTVFAFPHYVTPSYGGTSQCLDCHINASGTTGCGATSDHPRLPCLNAFGVAYFTSAWGAVLSDGDVDGDGITNGAELPAASSAGLHERAEERGCNMDLAVIGPGAWVDCASGNVQIRATFSSSPRNNYAFTFRCRPGTSGTASGTGTWNCFDVNECVTSPCGVGSCTQLPLSGWMAPGYSCACPQGYAFNGTTCVASHPCTTGTHDCSPNASCTLTGASSYDCTCNAGYAGNGVTCNDVNECAGMPCGVGACDNQPGSYLCICPAGYVAANGTCQDVDECAGAPCGVGACANHPGSYSCNCPAGFAFDGITCQDIDECATSPCGAHGICAQIPGPVVPTPGYTCTCDAGWASDGVTCVDVDECDTGAHDCDATEVCVNQVGAPPECDCAPGRVRQTDGSCVAVCGDGVVIAGEGCDDGNATPQDGCSDTCEVEPGWACSGQSGGPSQCAETCGDGTVDELEQCDEGPANSETAPGACRTDCTLARCGDGVVDPSETCDDGDANSDTAPDACRAACVQPFCGDGVIDSTETCDPGGGPRDVSDCANCDAVEVVPAGCGCTSGVGALTLLVCAALPLFFRRRRR